MEPLQMFLDTEHIGTGLGRALWNHAVQEAASRSHRLLIQSDPEAIGFYRAMGAELEKEVEVTPASDWA